jgi:hypothetical protein
MVSYEEHPPTTYEVHYLNDKTGFWRAEAVIAVEEVEVAVERKFLGFR